MPSYSFVTSTIENGKFADLKYDWSLWPREQQIKEAKQLFKAAGYGPSHPLQLSISFNTLDAHRKIALAISSMWQSVFGANSIKVSINNMEWKTFIVARQNANFEIARDSWVADYNSVDNYTNNYLCASVVNNSKYCNLAYDQLINSAAKSNTDDRINEIKAALKLAMDDYAIIPLYQYTYYRLIKLRVQGYDMETNHFDHVMSKWYQLKN